MVVKDLLHSHQLAMHTVSPGIAAVAAIIPNDVVCDEPITHECQWL